MTHVSLSLKPGTTLSDGRYTIKKELESGGFGITYLANANIGSLHDKPLVIKEFFLNGCFRSEDNSVTLTSRVGSNSFDDALRKFKEEADKIFKLRNHSGIVNVEDRFNDNGTSYYVMEFIQRPHEYNTDGIEKGMTFKDLLKGNPPTTIADLLDFLYYTWQIADALNFSHSHDVYHMDVKPSNFLIADEPNTIELPGRPPYNQYKLKLIDFGSAKLIQQDGQMTTTMTGTEGFTAPEIREGEFVSSASKDISLLPKPDIYSLGASLLNCFTAKVPIGINAIQRNIQSSAVAIPAEMEQLITKSMAYAPKKRYRDMAEMQQAIEEVILSMTSEGSVENEEPMTLLIEPSHDHKPSIKEAKTPPAKTKSPPKKQGARRWLIGLFTVIVLVAAALAISQFTGKNDAVESISESQKQQVEGFVMAKNYSDGLKVARQLLNETDSKASDWLNDRISFCEYMLEGDRLNKQGNCDEALKQYNNAKAIAIHDELVNKEINRVELTKRINGCN